MQSSGDYIKQVTFIFIVLLLSQIVFFYVAIWHIMPAREDDFDKEFRIADAIVFVVCLVGSYYLFVRNLKRARIPRGIREKLVIYRTGLYTQWLILEILSIFSIISYIMTGDFLFIFTTVFAIVVFLVNRPTINRTCDELELDSNERRVLKTKDAAI